MTLTTSPAPSLTTPIRRRDRTLGLAGIGFVAVLLPVVVIPHPGLDYPVDRPPASSVFTTFFRQHYALEQYQALSHSLAGVLLVVFGCALAAQVARREGAGQLAGRLVTAGSALAGALMVGTMLLVAGSITLTGGVDGRTQGWIYSLGWEAHFKVLYAVPLVLVPAAIVLGRSRALPRALTWTALLLGVLSVVAMVGGLGAGTDFLQFPVFFLLMFWVLATGIVALTRGVGE